MPGAELEIVGAVRGGDVDEAGALLGVDEVRRQHRHLELVAQAVQRVAQDGAGERRAGQLGQRPVAGDAGLGGDALDQARGEQQLLPDHRMAARAGGRHLDQPVVDLRAIGDRAVARHGPGRGGPDQHRRAGELGDRWLFTTGKRTVIVVEVWSWYSTSASASAVFSTTDHITDFLPR